MLNLNSNDKTFFISEVSSNHSQDINRALKFIDVSATVGANAVKFQLFKINELFFEHHVCNQFMFNGWWGVNQVNATLAEFYHLLFRLRPMGICCHSWI